MDICDLCGGVLWIDKIAYIDIGTVVNSINGRYIRKIRDGKEACVFFFESLKDAMAYEYDGVPYAKERFNSIEELRKVLSGLTLKFGRDKVEIFIGSRYFGKCVDRSILEVLFPENFAIGYRETN